MVQHKKPGIIQRIGEGIRVITGAGRRPDFATEQMYTVSQILHHFNKRYQADAGLITSTG